MERLPASGNIHQKSLSVPFLFGTGGGRPGGARPGGDGGDSGLVVGVARRDDALARRARVGERPARRGGARLASRWRAAGDAQRERARAARIAPAELRWGGRLRALYMCMCAPSVRSARGPDGSQRRPHGCRAGCCMCVCSVSLAEMNIFYYRRARV